MQASAAVWLCLVDNLGYQKTFPLTSTIVSSPCRHWKGALPLAELVAVSEAVENEAWSSQKAAGIDLIALDGTAYDHVLDTTVWLGVSPARFKVRSQSSLFSLTAHLECSVICSMQCIVSHVSRCAYATVKCPHDARWPRFPETVTKVCCTTKCAVPPTYCLLCHF